METCIFCPFCCLYVETAYFLIKASLHNWRGGDTRLEGCQLSSDGLAHDETRLALLGQPEVFWRIGKVAAIAQHTVRELDTIGNDAVNIGTFIGETELFLYLGREPEVVCVAEGEPICSCFGSSDVSRRAGTAI